MPSIQTLIKKYGYHSLGTMVDKFTGRQIPPSAHKSIYITAQ